MSCGVAVKLIYIVMSIIASQMSGLILSLCFELLYCFPGQYKKSWGEIEILFFFLFNLLPVDVIYLLFSSVQIFYNSLRTCYLDSN